MTLAYTWICDGIDCEKRVAESDEMPKGWSTALIEERERTAKLSFKGVNGSFCSAACRQSWFKAHLDELGNFVV